MCGICGCSDHEVGAHHHHHPDHTLVQIEEDLLAENERFAQANQALFNQQGVRAYNLMSSPGSGKTSLLAKTLADLQGRLSAAVVVGDQETACDADQLKASGIKAVQVNTGRVCHLDAHALGHALESLNLSSGTRLFIENVGNLVCPALFNLGEHKKIVILSVAEGENKPLKYPEMFRHADLLLVTKTDLLPYLTFNLDQAIDYARKINPRLTVLPLSAKTGEGLADWYQWLMTEGQ